MVCTMWSAGRYISTPSFYKQYRYIAGVGRKRDGRSWPCFEDLLDNWRDMLNSAQIMMVERFTSGL